MNNLKFGFFNRLSISIFEKKSFKTYLENDSEFSNYLYHYTNNFRDFKTLYVCYDTTQEKILAYMFVDKKYIYVIDTIIKGKGLAKKMIDYYDNKFNIKIIPENKAEGSEKYWQKYGY